MKSQKLSILALAAVLIVTPLVDTGLGAWPYRLGSLLGRAETVLVVRMASRTETEAVFVVAQVLRGDPKLQKLSLSRTRTGRGLPKNTRGLLLFSQGDNYWGRPKDSFQVGQPIKGQASYRGWILMNGPGESKEELDRLTELVKKHPFTQSQPERRKWKTAKEAEVSPAATEPERQRSDRASPTRDRARQIAHDALSKALLREYGDDARAMLSADVSDERLSVRREAEAGWKETEGGKKAIWVALLQAKGGGYCGFAMIHDGNGTVLKLLIPTKAGRNKALHRVRKWVKQRGAPAKIEWQPNGEYQMEWRVSEREMALVGPFVISVHPEKEPYVHARR